MASPNRIMELSSLIAKETEKLNDFFVKNNLPTPSLDVDALWLLPIPADAADLEASRQAIVEACSELQDLMTGPKNLLRFKWTAYASVKAILRFKLDSSFPVGESTSFEAMSKFSGLNVVNVRRIVRHAIINHHWFREDAPGVITHSALTAILATDPVMRNSMIVELDEFWPAAVKMADAMEKWPNSEESNETGFSLSNNSNKNMYEIFAGNPERGERFGAYFSREDEPGRMLLDNYPWGSHETIIDVGGSHGSVAIEIAKKFSKVKCIVQDLADTAAEGASRLPAELQDRQPVTADVYYFRSIFHNWADKYCIKILQNLIPALKKGAKIVVHERILPGLANLSTDHKRRVINLDVGMQQLLNAKQREMHEWSELFQQADPRFKYLGAHRPDGAIRWIIVAEWQG
ncbi:S-adenosyl-L-methionine-dependent methyltransferase [Hypoxylon trugodes]|uniref:S-adenosyl-L-methionine-dependent methyltransferase n=1 Tax=Hypoxylon trugodes TaxID=326681 RepID=UPI00219F66D4|nr:S-adenosyl-L-methionine-dependent methyltransferase [Hypoxylon trugodes]KAI1394365.1 S-adenosyl-L-methionine-dependent methyltransferase [Hypoxylon trugodes]